MTRRVLVLAVLGVLLATTGVALWRSAAGSSASDPDRIAAGLRCLTCEGETVADSASPVAAAMRETIDDQLADGRSPEQIRDWFVERYGPQILADPPVLGIGVLLWVLPGIALLVGVLVAGRTLLRRPARVDPPPGPARDGAPVRAGPVTWYAVAVALVGLVAAVAAVGTATSTDEPAAEAAPSSQRPADPAAEQLALGRRLERQGDFAAAARAYRAAVELRADPRVELHLAFALLRADRPAEAQDIASGVLAERPGDPEAVLLVGLAQRARHSPEAEATLRRFLRLTPDHPAAAEVRALVDQR